MRHNLSIILFFCLLSLPIKAQWEKTILPIASTEDLYSLSFLNDSAFFVCSNTQVSKTTNVGESWRVTAVNDGFPSGSIFARALKSIHFFDPNNGLMTGVFNQSNVEIVLKTSNGGKDWAPAYSNSPFSLPAFFNALDARGQHVLACGLNGHLIRSTNAGGSFSNVNTTPGLALNEVKFINASKAIAVGTGGVLKTMNAGITWTPDPAFAGKALSSIAVAGAGRVYLAGAAGLYQSLNDGLNFTSLSLPAIGVLKTVAATHDTLFVGTENGVFLSVNGGRYWQQFKSTKNHAVNKLEIRNGKVYALCKNRTLLALDMANMQPEPIAFFTSNVDLRCGESILGAQGLVDLNHATVQWHLNGELVGTDASFSHRYDSLPWYTQVVRLVVTDKNNFKTDTLTEMISVGFRDGLVADVGPDIHQCYGATMNLQSLGTTQWVEWFPHEAFEVEHENYYSKTIALKPLYKDTEIILVASNDSKCYDYDTLTIYVGEQITEHYHFTDPQVPNGCNNASCAHIVDMEFFSDSLGYAMAGGNGSVFLKTTDAANTWTATVLGGPFSNSSPAMDFVNDSVGYTTGPEMKTTDGGKTFTVVPINADLLSYADENNGVYVANGSLTFHTVVYKTTDGGQTFDVIYDTNKDLSIIVSRIKMVNDTLIYMAGGNGNTGRLLRSTNGGLSWGTISVPFNYRLVDMALISKDTFFVIDGVYIHRTYDSGKSWYSYYNPARDIKMLNATTGYAIAGRTLYKTINGGDCWTPVFTAKHPETDALAIAPSGKSVYFAANQSYQNGPLVYRTRFYREIKGRLDPVSCVGTPIRTHNQSFGYTHYQWYINDVPHSNGYDAELFFAKPGDYTVKVVMDSMGFYPDSLSFPLHIKPAPGPVGAIEGPVSVCTVGNVPPIPPIFPAEFTIRENTHYPNHVWYNEHSPNVAVEAYLQDSARLYRLNFLFVSNEATKIYVYGIDTLGCHSDTVSHLVRTQSALPPDPTSIVLSTYCLAIDSSSFIDNMPMDSIYCSAPPADNTDIYEFIYSSTGFSAATPSVAIPNYAPCAGFYDIRLYNINACGASKNYAQQFYGVRFDRLKIAHTADTTVASFSPVDLKITASFDSLFQTWGCPPLPIDWYFNDVFYSSASVLQFGAVTPTDTGLYTARIYNGCDTIAIPIRLQISEVVRAAETAGYGNIQLFPNPSDGVFSIELPAPAMPSLVFRVIDLAGRLVLEKQVEVGSTYQTMEAAALPAGLYFLQVVTGGRMLAVERFVVQ